MLGMFLSAADRHLGRLLETHKAFKNVGGATAISVYCASIRTRAGCCVGPDSLRLVANKSGGMELNAGKGKHAVAMEERPTPENLVGCSVGYYGQGGVF